MSLLEDANELIDELRGKLALYRSVGNYTVNALERATDDLEDQIHNVSDVSDVDAYEKRREELYEKLNAIHDDLGE